MEEHCCGRATGQSEILLVKCFRCVSINVKSLVLVIFDDYGALTKDANRNVRSGKTSQVVNIIAENSCLSDLTEFLRDYAHKQRSFNESAEALEPIGFEIVLYPSDADTTIVRTLLETRVSRSRYWQMRQAFFVSFCIKYLFSK